VPPEERCHERTDDGVKKKYFQIEIERGKKDKMESGRWGVTTDSKSPHTIVNKAGSKNNSEEKGG